MLIAGDADDATSAEGAVPPLVLIADDDGATRAMLGSWLAGSGFGVVEARDGEEALRLAGDRGPDLLLVDVIMPGLDGLEVCRALRVDGEGPPVIVITAHDREEGRATGLDAGAVDYMVKPFGQEELIARVHSALAAAARGDVVEEQPADEDLPLVLIADDDGATRAMLGSWLARSGFGVVEARDGEEALRLAGDRGPDLLLVDVIMPGIDGFEVCRALRADGEGPPVIVITAHDQAGHRGIGLEAGAVDYIVKPFGQEELVARVHSALAAVARGDVVEEQPADEDLPLVLIADDHSLTRAMAESWLTVSGFGVVQARDGEEALRLAGELGPDLVVVDVVMPGIDGFEVCRALRVDGGPPVIVITAHDQAGHRGIGLEAGAVDFIVKPFGQEELVARVRAALRTKAERDGLADKAAHDALTGLLNRRELDARAKEVVALAQRHGRPLSCLLLDLDHFKQVNDVHGHAAGDQVLRETGRRLAAACRISDIVARYGGEEFVLLLPETPLEAAVILADKLRAALTGTPFEAGSALVSIRASVGVAGLTTAMQTPSALLDSADEALYRAKRLGRDRTELHDPDRLAAST